jgi:hypothetical protein
MGRVSVSKKRIEPVSCYQDKTGSRRGHELVFILQCNRTEGD